MTEGSIGHNRFDPQVYKVPFYSSGISSDDAQGIHSHDDLYRLIARGMGYAHLTPLPVRIHGSMQNGEDGFLYESAEGFRRGWY